MHLHPMLTDPRLAHLPFVVYVGPEACRSSVQYTDELDEPAEPVVTTFKQAVAAAYNAAGKSRSAPKKKKK